MNHRRSLLLVTALVAVFALAASTGGFSSVSADRTMEVEVVADRYAYLGVEQTPTGIENGTTNLTVAITNRFEGATLEVAVTTVSDNTGETISRLSPGESASVRLESIDCDGSITVEATSEAVEVVLSREVEC